MKLKRKLMPLFGALTVITAVTPITLVSCEGDDKSDDYIDMLSPYWEHAIQLQPDSYTIDQANEQFINDCKNNPNILDSEVYSSLSAYSRMWNEATDFIVSRKMRNYESMIKVSDASIISQDFVDEAGATHKIPTVSYVMDGHVKFATEGEMRFSRDRNNEYLMAEKLSPVGITHCFTNYHIDIKNVPITMQEESTGKMPEYTLPSSYGFYPMGEWMLESDEEKAPMDWSVAINIDVETKYSSYKADLADFESYSRQHLFTPENYSSLDDFNKNVFDFLVIGNGWNPTPSTIWNTECINSYSNIPPVGFMSLYFAPTIVLIIDRR